MLAARLGADLGVIGVQVVRVGMDSPPICASSTRRRSSRS
jgi:hypothetical protein